MPRNLLKEVWDLVTPVIIQGMVVTMVFFTDRLLLGRYDDTALASMQISGPLLWSLFSVFTAFIAGTMAVIGRAVGAKDKETARKTLHSVLILAIAIGIVMTIVCLALRPWFATNLAGSTGTEAAKDMAMLYMGIVFYGLTLNMIQVTGVTALQADGDTKTPMWISGIQGALNLGISWVLLWGYGPFPEMGIEGAAIGTFVSFATGCVLIITVLIRRSGTVKWRPFRRPSRSALRPVVRLSIPAFAEKILFHTEALVTRSFGLYVTSKKSEQPEFPKLDTARVS